MKNKNIALFFGSFNPIHVGHLIIANYVASLEEMDEVWLVVSPQNPLKEKKSLLKDYHRLALVNEAIENNPKLKSCDIEFNLPQPSYTVDTLVHLTEKYPNYTFNLVMGEDNIKTIHKWKNHQVLLDNYQIYVYPRIGSMDSSITKPLGDNVIFCNDVPLMHISASYIRKAIKTEKM